MRNNITIRSGILCLLITICFIVILLILLVGGKKNINNSTKLSPYHINDSDVILNNKEDNPKVKVFLTKEQKVIELDLEDYIKGVVAGEMPISYEREALKAQAVAARTYALSKIACIGGTPCTLHSGVDLCDTTHCQVYKKKEEVGEINWTKVTDAVNSTAGEILTYNGKLVSEPLYFSSSGGRTEDASSVFASNVPYLRGVESYGEDKEKNNITTVRINSNEFTNKINKAYPNAKISVYKLKSQVKILSRNTGGTVNELKIGNEVIKGKNFRELLSLKSSNFNLEFLSNEVEITCIGYGHYVGMSQVGANLMAKRSNNYKDILTHYYNGVEVEKISYSK